MAREQRAGGVPDGLLVGLLGFLLSLTLLVWTATGLSALFSRGAWPNGVSFTRTPQAVRSLAGNPQDLASAWPKTVPGALSGYGLFWGVLIGELMVLAVLTVFAVGTLARWRTVRERRREAYGAGRAARGDTRHRPPGSPARTGAAGEPRILASGGEPDPSDMAAPAAPATLPVEDRRPGAGSRPVEAVVPTPPGPTSWPTSATTPVPAPGAPGPVPAPLPSPRTASLLYGAPATRRPAALQAVRDAEGPALVVSSDPTVWADTKDARGKLGPVLLYDPGHLCDTPARIRWSPTDRCADPAVAKERAVALLAPVRPPSRLDLAVADTAETLLRCWLHAAAVDARPFKQVHRWAQGAGAHEPVRILRTHAGATSGHAGLLESALTAHPERREMAQRLTARALSSLSSVHIRDACTPSRTDSLALESFLAEGGTLYVVGEPIEDPRTRPGAMPLLTALTASVVEHGRRVAARSSDGRLDPPLSVVLDDVAAVAPLPGLPELLAHGHAEGLPALVLLRSREQARARWPEETLAP
ncbi:type IV secretory system conjugative DNA transfer family protein [Streptomyces sp. NBC_01216]|uniref:type IV secretory system conjugative DNA transfer family protein n=1 Tax=Streptomyces sp. NBC_01216 TaxID=2903778 RepID=UPI002E11E384|nr:type IV secretory system conjugative DNA transfer family protein [Streptomyces sp. NBC_01216]